MAVVFLNLFAPPRILLYCQTPPSEPYICPNATMTLLLSPIQCSSSHSSSSFSRSASHSVSPVSSISSVSSSPSPKSTYERITVLLSPAFADVSFLEGLASTLKKGAGDLVFLTVHNDNGNDKDDDKDTVKTLLRKSLMEMGCDRALWRQVMGNLNGEYRHDRDQVSPITLLTVAWYWV